MASDYMLLSEFFLDELPEEHPWRGNIKGIIEKLLAAGVTFKRDPYPHRTPPRKWPDMKLIGKAMVRGWAVPCRYYPSHWRRGGHCRSFVFPGITDTEMKFIHALMGKEETK